jgi:hypothetical protein
MLGYYTLLPPRYQAVGCVAADQRCDAPAVVAADRCRLLSLMSATFADVGYSLMSAISALLLLCRCCRFFFLPISAAPPLLSLDR